VKRHIEFFNTHPILGAMVLGAGVRLEESAAAGEIDPARVGAFKMGWMGSLGAIGDSFFWGSLRPMASVAGAILALVHPLLGIAALLVLYNLTHLAIRRRCFAAGMQGEEAAIEWLKRESLNVKTGNRKVAAAGPGRRLRRDLHRADGGVRRDRDARRRAVPDRGRRHPVRHDDVPQGGVAVRDPCVSSSRGGADPVAVNAEREFDIRNRHGLHARAAAQLVRVANQSASDGRLGKEGMAVTGKSIMGVLMPAAPKDTKIRVRVFGEDAEAALIAIGELIDGKFGEE
jgi:phosphotransferase system HPr (HPr) family protein